MTQAVMSGTNSIEFAYESYSIHRQFFKLFGGTFRIYDPTGKLVLFADMKAFKLREDIRLYTGEDKKLEVLTIKARNILDVSATYDVVDARSGQKVGALKRRGIKSALVRDEWQLLDQNETEIGRIREDHIVLALLRRFITGLIPQTFHCEMKNLTVCTYMQNLNPITLKLSVNFTQDFAKQLDRRLGLAAGVLLCAIEGREG